jgi:branched-subunit amino acid transport protein AzlD
MIPMLTVLLADLVIITSLLALYLLPFIIAKTRKHRNAAAIGVLNLLLGWTVLGWIGALVWACTDNCQEIR